MCQVPEFLGAGARHWGFMLRGLRELEANLEKAGVKFFLLKVQSYYFSLEIRTELLNLQVDRHSSSILCPIGESLCDRS